MKQTKEIAKTEEQKPQVLPTGKVFTLAPTNLSEAMKLAEMIAGSDLAPKDFKGKAGNCLIAMQMGMELDIPPMQAIQNIAVINGRPGVYGDLGKALLLSKGFKIEERDIKEIQAKGESWTRITRPDGAVIERTYSIDNAKTAKLWGKEGPWTTNPYRQMAWRSFWFAARDAGSDVLKGLGGAEELRDYVETTATDVPPVPMPKPLGATPPADDTEKSAEGKPMLSGELVFFINELKRKGADLDDVRSYAASHFKVGALESLTRTQAKEILGLFQDEPVAAK